MVGAGSEGVPRADLIERRLAAHRPGLPGIVAALALLSAAAALLVARPGWFDGPWLWNLDMPKVDGPLALFHHRALAAGRLPLWEDALGLGYPLYAEGQVGAFYPPNWLFFLLPPLAALDLVRIVHLVLAGVGAGLLGLRLTGSRAAAIVPASVAVLGGAIATKLEWHNLVVAYGWLPWVLLPLAGRRTVPSRWAAVASGIAWGIQALAGHPNTWLLTGVAAIALAMAGAPRLATLGRLAVAGLVGVAVGAVQLVPTAILATLSVRGVALSPSDLFGAAATPFDALGFAFANAFAPGGPDGTWDRYAAWYPDGTFALLEASAYVGLPVLALAAVGAAGPGGRLRRGRRILVVACLLLAIPVVAAFQPPAWSAIPLLNVLRSPVRAYLVVSLLLGLLAALGVARLGAAADRPRDPGPSGARSSLEPAALVLACAVGLLGGTILLASVVPDAFDALYRFGSSFLDPAELPDRRARALAVLAAPFPLAAELLLGAVAIVLVRLARGRALHRRIARLALVAAAIAPLALFGRAANPTADATAFSTGGSAFVRTLAGTDAHRVLTLGEPGWYDGMPNQLAAAGVPDLRMFSSLDLAASDSLLDAVRAEGATDLRRAVGIDVIVAFGDRSCPGVEVATVAAERATVCRDPGAVRPPWWVAAERVGPPTDPGAGDGLRLPWVPVDREVDLSGREGPLAARTVETAPGVVEATVTAPADGWVWIDRAWWPGWEVRVDGRRVDADRALAGLLVPVQAGEHAIEARLVPWDALAGLGLGIAVLLVVLRWAGRPRPVRRPRPARRPTPGRRSTTGERAVSLPAMDGRSVEAGAMRDPRRSTPGSDGLLADDGPFAGTVLLAFLRWLRRHPDLSGGLGFAIVAAFAYLWTASPDPSPFDYFVRLADAFLQGRIWLTDAPSWLNELVPKDGVFYVVYPPVPAVLMTPFVALFGPGVPQQYGTAVYGGVAVGLAWILFRRLRVPGSAALLLTLTFGFGTVLWWAAATGSAWVFGHVSAVLFLVASLILAVERRLPLLAGVLLGLAVLSRLPVVLAAPLPLALYAGLPAPQRLGSIRLVREEAIGWLRRALPFAAGLGVLILVYALYNLARWGTVVDRGYTLIPGVLEDPIYAAHGIFALEYIPRHLFAIFLRSWNFVDAPPFLQPSWWGLAVPLTTPLYAWLARSRRDDPWVAWALVATALTLVPIVTHGNVGVAQFGYRFSLDVQPLLFVALASAFRNGETRGAWAAAGLSVVVCAYAVWAIGIGFVDY